MLSSWKICCVRVPQRWIFAVMACLATTNAYAMRVCLSLTITHMVRTSQTSANDTVTDETCSSLESTSSGSSSSGGTYDWDEYTQGVILSSFFWGYIITQIPGSILSEKFGGKYTLGLGIFSTAIFSVVTPVVVEAYGSVGLIILRVLMGLGEGVSFPATSVLVSQWAPPNERTKIGAVVSSGSAVGTMMGNAVTGILIQNSSIGWPIVFYFFGACGILWFFAWVVLCYNNPDEHPFISDKEKKYLNDTTSEHTHKHVQPTPWWLILTSVPVWAMLIGKFGYAWGWYTMITDLPKYMSSVLKFSIQANGFLTALPYMLQLVASYAASWHADWLIKSKKMSRTNVRKMWFAIAMIMPAVFIIAASYAGCDRTAVVVLFTIGVTMMGPTFSSLFVIPNDLSPNYAGTIMAISGVVANLAGILAPYVVGILTPNQTVLEWRIVFWITFVVLLMSTLLFVIFAQGEVQYWNDPETKGDCEKAVNEKTEVIRDTAFSTIQP